MAKTSVKGKHQNLFDIISDNTGTVNIEIGQLVKCEFTGWNTVINLPPATDYINKFVGIEKANNSGNILQIVPNGTDTVQGDTDAEIRNQGTSVTLVSDGSNWQIA